MNTTNTLEVEFVLENDEQLPEHKNDQELITEQDKKGESREDRKDELSTGKVNENNSTKEKKELPFTQANEYDLPSKKEIELPLTPKAEENFKSCSVSKNGEKLASEQDKIKQKMPVERFLRAAASDMYVVRDEDSVTTIVNRHLSFEHVAPDCEEYWSFNNMLYGRNFFPTNEDANERVLERKQRGRTNLKPKASVYTTNIHVSRTVCDESGKKSNECNCSYKGTTIRVDGSERSKRYTEFNPKLLSD
ncbi:uncharacterized protein LOC119662770 [Teleopsis dalmanni]|uniref:uncharacterized protein LOC119662770 n=1 Tax=Teleopsis dalmanni TaxID=139649 RepID=UPI0018CEF81D|nr:uncharacterized protein LOC119662770 [Teleopsis dalmanni]